MLLFNIILFQLGQKGTTALNMDPSTYQTGLIELKLEQCNGILTWCSKEGPTVSLQETNELSSGLKIKYIMKCKDNLINMKEGFIDMTTLKTVELGFVDMIVVPKRTLSAISSCFKVYISSHY